MMICVRMYKLTLKVNMLSDSIDSAKLSRERQALEVKKRAKRRAAIAQSKKPSKTRNNPVKGTSTNTVVPKLNNFNRTPYKKGMKSEFYQTFEWRQLRWKVLLESDKSCAMCGRTKAHGIILHVDHIKPRSKYPALELTQSNLQVLCEDCNIGKSNT